jgi:hypothetical protein
MIDSRSARIRTHRRNIQRYGRLLATELTDLERQYLHRRIVEEQAELERLARQDGITPFASARADQPHGVAPAGAPKERSPSTAVPK